MTKQHENGEGGQSQAQVESLTRWGATLTGGAFEDVFQALEEVVARLEQGQLTLEETVACYEMGSRLAERCERFLNEAELRVSRIDVLTQGFDDDVQPEEDDPSF